MHTEGDLTMTDFLPLLPPGDEQAQRLALDFDASKMPGRETFAHSLTLSASAYQMDTQPWKQQGWGDFSLLVDGQLLTGSKMSASRGVKGTVGKFLTRLARKRLRKSSIKRLYGTLKQKEKTETCKAMIAARPLPDGRTLIAIGFMGTGKRLLDWIANLRIQRSEGMHRGFLQLTEEFESHLPQIRFPRANQVTLAHVIQCCKAENSPYLIWMSGHSQGSAVMQLFTHRLLSQGVLPKYLLGVGFASPAVTHLGCTFDPPIHHMIFADDIVTRIGAKHHFGTCHVLTSSPALDRQYLGAYEGDALFRAVLSCTHRLYDTRTGLLFALALVRALRHLNARDAGAVLEMLTTGRMPDALADVLGDGARTLLKQTEQHLMRMYRSYTHGAAPNLKQLNAMTKQVLGALNSHTPLRYAMYLTKALTHPHHLQGEEGSYSPYQWMCGPGFDALRPMDALPARFPLLIAPEHPRRRQPLGKRRGTLTALRRSRRSLLDVQSADR